MLDLEKNIEEKLSELSNEFIELLRKKQSSFSVLEKLHYKYYMF